MGIPRTKSASKDAVDGYYRELKSLFTAPGLLDMPDNMYNEDQTGITIAHSTSKVACDKAGTD